MLGGTSDNGVGVCNSNENVGEDGARGPVSRLSSELPPLSTDGGGTRPLLGMGIGCLRVWERCWVDDGKEPPVEGSKSTCCGETDNAGCPSITIGVDGVFVPRSAVEGEKFSPPLAKGFCGGPCSGVDGRDPDILPCRKEMLPVRRFRAFGSCLTPRHR